MTELLRSDLNAFLFTPIAADTNGMHLTMLSALARAGADPWEKAAGTLEGRCDGEADRSSRGAAQRAIARQRHGHHGRAPRRATAFPARGLATAEIVANGAAAEQAGTTAVVVCFAAEGGQADNLLDRRADNHRPGVSGPLQQLVARCKAGFATWEHSLRILRQLSASQDVHER